MIRHTVGKSWRVLARGRKDFLKRFSNKTKPSRRVFEKTPCCLSAVCWWRERPGSPRWGRVILKSCSSTPPPSKVSCVHPGKKPVRMFYCWQFSSQNRVTSSSVLTTGSPPGELDCWGWAGGDDWSQAARGWRHARGTAEVFKFQSSRQEGRLKVMPTASRCNGEITQQTQIPCLFFFLFPFLEC